MSRYDRQIQLAEVGAIGQARLGQVAFLAPDECGDEEARFARLYAERCGMLPSAHQVDALPAGAATRAVTVGYPAHIAAHYKHTASAAIGVGAAVALAHVVTVLFEEPRGMERTHT